MASVLKPWEPWKAITNKSQSSTPKVTTPTYAYKDPYNPGSSSSSTTGTRSTSVNPNYNYEDAAQKIIKAKQDYANAQAMGNAAGMTAAHRAAEEARASVGYTGGNDGSQWIPLSSANDTSYPNNNLAYGPANGSNVPSFNISFPSSSSTTSTYDPDEASRRAQAQVDEYYKQQQDLANQQAAANRTSQLARLRAAYDTQRADINSQIPELEATAQQALTQNENDYYNKYKPQMLAAMEQSGGYKGGQMVDNMQGLITALQNNQNNVNTTKLQQEAKLRQALANLNTQQASDETQVNSNIDASTYDKLMSALQNSQQQKITLDQMYNDNAYKQASFGLQQQQMAYEKADRDNNIAMERAKLTGYLDPHPGMQLNQSVYDKYGSNLQAEIDRRKREGDPEGLIPQLEEWRYQKVINDPGLINKYGGMYQTIDGRQQQAQDLVKQISLAAQYDPRIGTSSFMGEYEWVVNNPKASLDHVLDKADLLKNEYGENGYNILLSVAKLAAGSV